TGQPSDEITAPMDSVSPETRTGTSTLTRPEAAASILRATDRASAGGTVERPISVVKPAAAATDVPDIATAEPPAPRGTSRTLDARALHRQSDQTGAPAGPGAVATRSARAAINSAALAKQRAEEDARAQA